jgi:hypothetical protein
LNDGDLPPVMPPRERVIDEGATYIKCMADPSYKLLTKIVDDLEVESDRIDSRLREIRRVLSDIKRANYQYKYAPEKFGLPG